MTKRQVTYDDFYIYLKEIFNIKGESILIDINLENSINKLPNPVDFINFAHDNIGDAKYQYMSGYQKFLRIYSDFRSVLINDFPKKDIDILNKFIYKTISTIGNIFDEIYYKTQVTGKSFTDVNIIKTLEKNLNEKQLLMIENAGDWNKIYDKYRLSPKSLENIIYDSAIELMIRKKYPSLLISNQNNNNENKKVN